jgi:hypothetical protein
MKLFQTLGVAALLSLSSTALAAQDLVNPGQLADPAASVRSPFASGISTMPKQDVIIIEDRHEKRVHAIWIASIFAMTAATTADAASSWHKHESNGILASSNGTFGGKGIALKAGIAAGFLTPQIVFRKHRDWQIAFAVGNFAEAGVFTGAAVHNLTVK